jgi:predicted acylesterase/phospholipase RssA
MPDRIGLALSGGGFRATLFHLGVVRLLYETGQLPLVKRIGAVSGGSVLAAHLVLNWERYTGSKEEFDKAAQEIFQFVQTDVRGWIVRRRIFAWIIGVLWRLMPQRRRWTLSNLLQKKYESLYGGKRLKALRAQEGTPDRPHVYFYSASLTSGAVCSFGRSGFRWHENDDNPYQKSIDVPNTPIAFAVTASSAFPPLFPPIEVSNETLYCDLDKFPYPHFLTDGGVYDNLGIDRLIWFQSTQPQLDLLISSDAQGNFDSKIETKFTSIISRNVRASDILMTRVSSIQLQRFTAPGSTPPLIRIGIKEEIFDPLDRTLLQPEAQRSLPNIRTDLDEFSPVEITALVAHGYNCARKKLIQEKLLAEDAPKFSWDPLSNWNTVRSGGTVEHLRRSSLRKLRVWSWRDPISYALLIACILPIAAVVWAVQQRYIAGQERIDLP